MLTPEQSEVIEEVRDDMEDLRTRVDRLQIPPAEVNVTVPPAEVQVNVPAAAAPTVNVPRPVGAEGEITGADGKKRSFKLTYLYHT